MPINRDDENAGNVVCAVMITLFACGFLWFVLAVSYSSGQRYGYGRGYDDGMRYCVKPNALERLGEEKR